MKKRHLLILFIVLTAITIIGSFYFSKSNEKKATIKPNEVYTSKNEEIETKTAPKNKKQYFISMKPLTGDVSKPNFQTKDFSGESECEKKVQNILYRGPTAFLEDIYLADTSTSSIPCIGEILNDNEILSKEHFNLCRKNPYDSDCIVDAMFIRSQIIDHLTSNKELGELSTNTLINKVHASISKDQQTKDELLKLYRLASEIQNRDTNLGYNKLKATILEKLTKIDDSYVNDFLNSADELYAQDPEEGLKLWHKYYAVRDYENFINIAKLHIEKYPTSEQAHYLLAVANYNLGNRNEADRIIRTMVLKDIKNSLISSQLSNYLKQP